MRITRHEIYLKLKKNIPYHYLREEIYSFWAKIYFLILYSFLIMQEKLVQYKSGRAATSNLPLLRNAKKHSGMRHATFV